MLKIDKSTPLAMLTVGQFNELITANISQGVLNTLRKEELLPDQKWSREAAREYLNVTNGTMTNLVKSGRLKAFGTPRKQQFLVSEVKALKSKGK